jgi:glycosyltransferase involved in cell wall biosynthesis
MRNKLSVVIPCYGDLSAIPTLLHQIEILDPEKFLSIEVILVLDDPNETSWIFLQSLRCNHELKLVRLARNFGQHVAIRAGLEKAEGDLVGIIDCDLQDEPHILEKMKELMTDGTEVIFSETITEKSPLHREIGRKLLSYLTRKLTGQNKPSNLGGPFLISRIAVNGILSFKEMADTRTLLFWLDYPSKTFLHRKAKRIHGDSSYTFRKLVGEAVIALSFSPVRFFKFIALASFVFSCLLLSFAALIVFESLRGSPPPGWLTTTVLIATSSAFLSLLISTIGYFVVLTLVSSRNRPLYIEIAGRD